MTDDGGSLNALRASAHPVRLRMLSLLTGTAMSAAEVARELGLTHANASYHLRLLADAGELVVDGEEKIRGGVAKRYRYPHERGGEHALPTRPTSPTRPTTDDERHYLRALGRELERRTTHRAAPARGYSFDLEGWVDPEVYERARALVREASTLLHDANRPPRTEGAVHVSATGVLFRMDAP